VECLFIFIFLLSGVLPSMALQGPDSTKERN